MFYCTQFRAAELVVYHTCNFEFKTRDIFTYLSLFITTSSIITMTKFTYFTTGSLLFMYVVCRKNPTNDINHLMKYWDYFGYFSWF
jgi:hypothetical protein